MAYFAERGYRVWAPDQRGYNLSDKPKRIKDYHISQLTKDIAGLIEQSPHKRVTIIGHDWDGIVTWRIAREYPQLIDKVVILNAPHEAAMQKQLVKHPTQLIRSSYAAFFQVRGLPERLISQNNWKMGTEMLEATSQSGAFTKEDLKHYREAWSKPGAMTAMINWYRANVKAMAHSDLPKQVTIPMLFIWGAKDQFLGQDLAHISSRYIEEGRLVFFEQATHWVHLEEADRVNDIIEGFI